MTHGPYQPPPIASNQELNQILVTTDKEYVDYLNYLSISLSVKVTTNIERYYRIQVAGTAVGKLQTNVFNNKKYIPLSHDEKI